MSVANNIAKTHSFRPEIVRAGSSNLKFSSFVSFGDEFINEHEEIVYKESIAWLKSMKAITSENHLKKIDGCLFYRLTSRTFAFADYDGLRLASDLMITAFLLDDMNDAVEPTDESSMESMIKIEKKMKSVLRGARAESDDHPLILCLQSILDRCSSLNAGWINLMKEELIRYLDSYHLERISRIDGSALKWPLFENIRYYTGGAVFFAFLSAAMGCAGSSYEVMLPPYTSILLRMATNHIHWVNDIISLNKEAKEAISGNMVEIISNRDQYTVTRAVEDALKRVNEQCEAFLDLESKLHSSGLLEGNEDTIIFIAVLKYWMRGSLDWHFESKRYAVDN